MPDTNAGSFGTLDGQEFVNSQRTISYIQNFNLPIKVSGDCWCPNIQTLAGCDTPATGYSFPANDPAPWYDTAIPESGDFLGFLPTEFDGLGSTYTRQTFDTLNGGAVLGRLRPQARTLTWKGFLFGRTCCAAEYGLRWLTARLADGGGCDGCDGAELDILICCPEATGITANDCKPFDVTSCSTSQSVGTSPGIGQTPNDDAFRTFYRTGLVDGPKILSKRTIGCGGDCDDGGCLIEAEFSIVAGNPFMHKLTQVVCGPVAFPSCDDGCDPANPIWIKVPNASFPSTAADGLRCIDPLDCTDLNSVSCTDDPNCPTATLPTIPDFEDPCGCEPFFSTTLCCSVSNNIYGMFFEGVPTIDVFAGPTHALKNVVLSFYENPQERTCTDTALFQSDCFKCASMNIRYIPANTTVTVDGLTRKVSAKCPGQDSQPAENLTVSPFTWPVLKCISYIITVTADCAFPIDPTSSVTISVTPREM